MHRLYVYNPNQVLPAYFYIYRLTFSVVRLLPQKHAYVRIERLRNHLSFHNDEKMQGQKRRKNRLGLH